MCVTYVLYQNVHDKWQLTVFVNGNFNDLLLQVLELDDPRLVRQLDPLLSEIQVSNSA